MRDNYKSELYFRDQILSGETRVEKFVAKLEDPSLSIQAKQSCLYFLYEIQLNRALSLLNLGNPISEVVTELNKAWPLLIDQLDFSLNTDLDPKSGMMGFVPSQKVKVLPLLVLSNSDKNVTSRIFDFTNTVLNHETDKENSRELDVSFDPFTYEFAKYFGYESDRVYNELTWPQLYEPLYECFTRHEGHRPDLLKNFVDNWQKVATKEELYTQNAHSLPTNKNFRGYWCFLGAAVAKMLRIDDHALKDHPHYPYDLVHYTPS